MELNPVRSDSGLTVQEVEEADPAECRSALHTKEPEGFRCGSVASDRWDFGCLRFFSPYRPLFAQGR
jgi:hypothetical protein